MGPAGASDLLFTGTFTAGANSLAVGGLAGVNSAHDLRPARFIRHDPDRNGNPPRSSADWSVQNYGYHPCQGPASPVTVTGGNGGGLAIGGLVGIDNNVLSWFDLHRLR